MSIKQKKRGVKTSLINANNTLVYHNQCNTALRYDYIPIDFIKGQIIGLSNSHFLNNKSLHFTPVIDKENAGLVKYEFVEYQNIRLKIYPNNRQYISGSIHKLYNKGLHNYNTFDSKAYKDALNRLYEAFRIEPKDIRIVCLEFGVNITPPYDTNEIIDNLMQHKGKDFEQKISNDKGKYTQCQHDNYIIKVYNKAKQYKVSNPILRTEIKQKNWSEYRLKYNIITLEDFNNHDKTIFLESLLNKWNEIVFYDPTNKNVKELIKYSNVNFWRGKRKESRTTQKRHRDKLKKLNKTNGLNIQNSISNRIVEHVKNTQLYTFSKFSKNCIITNLDISMQKQKSKLLSHVGLRHYCINNKKLFDEVKHKFLSNKWIHEPIEVQIKEIAHNIRNKFYNSEHRKPPKNQLKLFS